MWLFIRKDIKRTIKQELAVYRVSIKDRILLNETYYIYKYQMNLRKAEYYRRNFARGGVFKLLYIIYRRKLGYWSMKTGIFIGMNHVGYGLRIMHTGTILVNGTIGRNCNLYGQVLLGQTKDFQHIPTVGDNVSICSGSRIIGKVNVGNNVVVAPNAVVTHDVPDNAIVVGIPAKILRFRDKNEAR